MTPASPGDYYHIVNNTQMIGGVAPPEQRDPNTPPHWLTYFAVADCAAATRKAVSLGATALPRLDGDRRQRDRLGHRRSAGRGVRDASSEVRPVKRTSLHNTEGTETSKELNVKV